MRQILILVAVCCVMAVTLQAQQIYLADNGLTASGSGTTKKVSLGGNLLNAQTIIDFGSANSSSSLLFRKGTTNYFFIGNNGNIGIGTNAPANKLSIAGATATNFGLQFPGLTNATATTINSTRALALDASGNVVWANITGGSGWALTGNAGTTSSNFIGTTDAQPLRFRVNTSVDATDRLYIAPNGNIGINTTSPIAKLSINSAVPGNTGLQLVQLNTGTPANLSNGKVLNVDFNGMVVLESLGGLALKNKVNNTDWTGVALSPTNGGTGLSALGTANQQLRVNAAGTGLEYFTPAAGGGSYTFTNGLTNNSGTVKLGGALTGNTTISGMDSSLNFLFNNGSYQTIGTTGNYIGEVQRYSNGRWHMYSELRTAPNDYWNSNHSVDTLAKSATTQSIEPIWGFKWDVKKYASFLGFNPRPLYTSYEGGNNARMGFGNTALEGLYIDTFKFNGPQVRLYAFGLDGKIRFYAAPPTGNSADSILVWDAATKIVKKIAPSSVGSSNWTSSGNNMYNANTGFVSIGTSANPAPADADLKLAVSGNVYAKKVVVTLGGWADYVFAKNYRLPSLKEVEEFIRRHQHLPDIPSAAEVEKNGIDVGGNQALLLKKIEELTLYLIDQNKRLEEQNNKMNQQQKEIEELKKKLGGN